MLRPRPLLNDEWIENQQMEIQEEGSIEFYSSPPFWVGFLDPDETEVFKECYEKKTDQMCYDWEVRHEYEDVISHGNKALKYRLKDAQLYNIIPTEDQIEEVNGALHDAACDLAYQYAESWHYFFVINGLMPLTRNIENFFGKTKEELNKAYNENRGQPYISYRQRGLIVG